MISVELKSEINDHLMAKFQLSSKLHWEQINEGYTNENYTIMKSNGYPIAVCKIFTDDEIYLSKERFKREISALEKYSETIAPQILFQKSSKILVYQYVEGTGLHQLSPKLIVIKQIKKTLDTLHSVSISKRKTLKSDVTSFYNNIATRYQKSKLSYPQKLIDTLQTLAHQQEELLDNYSEYLSYVHGDLIPPNLIYRNNKITLIDWEFSRTELVFFDYQYLNYYAKAHNLSIKIEMDDDLQLFYNELIDVLERLWRYGYLSKNKKIDYSI
ncbi:MAG: aminoglycoside phosphotransferase family protein [Candidatus Heimdallarchaeaceae archaeon]